MEAQNHIKKLMRKVLRDRLKMEKGMAGKVLDIEKWPQKWQDKIQKAQVIAGYMPLPDELSLEEFWKSPALIGKRKCFPRVEGEKIVFYEMDPDTFVKGSFGIWEPSGVSSPVERSQIDIMLIPACGYGMDGTRIGRGKGFYDRFFDGAVTCETIGVVPEVALLHVMPSDSWDLRVSAVATQERFIECEIRGEKEGK